MAVKTLTTTDDGGLDRLIFSEMTLQDLPAVLRIERQSFTTPWSERAFVSELTHNVYADYIVARLLPAGAEGQGNAAPAAAGPARRRGPGGWTGRPAGGPPAGEVIGYAGMWIVLDEAHITNVAVAPEYRGRDVGDRLLSELERRARLRGCQRMTLEVRPSNVVAQALYRKHGFVARGRRPGYYSDTNEDAIIMWKDSL